MLSLADRLEAYVHHLSDDIGPRHYRRPEALDGPREPVFAPVCG